MSNLKLEFQAFLENQLFTAIREGDIAKLKELITDYKIDVNAKDTSGWPAVLIAVFYGKLECVKILKEAGADLNAKNNFGVTPIIQAVMNENFECLKFLKEAGADLNLQDTSGWNVAFWAVYTEKPPKFLKFLLDAGIDLSATDNCKRTLLIMAEMIPTVRGRQFVGELTNRMFSRKKSFKKRWS